jgi:high frequency lysogenization protein
MPTSHTDKTLALAGIIQAAHLVQHIAKRGTVNDSLAFEASIASIVRTDAESTEAVYGGSGGVTAGLKLLRAQLTKQSATRDLELTKYFIGILYLERQLAKRAAMLDKIAEGIEKARAQMQYFSGEDSSTHSNVIASLAGIYSDTLSTLTPRIVVNGEQRYLDNPDNANKIRAILLAAIRSAVLWRQSGGGRLQLLLARSATLLTIEDILKK